MRSSSVSSSPVVASNSPQHSNAGQSCSVMSLMQAPTPEDVLPPANKITRLNSVGEKRPPLPFFLSLSLSRNVFLCSSSSMRAAACRLCCRSHSRRLFSTRKGILKDHHVHFGRTSKEEGNNKKLCFTSFSIMSPITIYNLPFSFSVRPFIHLRLMSSSIQSLRL
jgi:hypothetical protein